MGRGSKQMFLQGDIHTEGQEAHEKTFNIVFREMQIKTTMRYVVRKAIIKKSTNRTYLVAQ